MSLPPGFRRTSRRRTCLNDAVKYTAWGVRLIRREYSALERRAVNQVYNGAGRYDFEPAFLAISPDGEPDFYLNMLIGLSVKWFDSAKLQAFFDSYSDNVRAEELDVIVWLGLENALYEKELPERPILRQLRMEYARTFFRKHTDLSRQQSMAVSMRVLEQRQTRWADVLGEKRPLLTAGAKKLADRLLLSPSLDTHGVIRELENILTEYFHIRSFSDAAFGRRTKITASAILKQIMYRQTHEVDTLLIRQSGIRHEGTAKTRSLLRGGRISVRTTGDADYIRACFGPCLYSDYEMKLLENELCRGNDEKCRLYIAGAGKDQTPNAESAGSALQKTIGTAFSPEGEEKTGKKSAPNEAAPGRTGDGKIDRETEEVRRAIENQRSRNKAYLEKSGQLITSSITTLSASLDTILSTFAEPLPETASKGKLNTAKCYRLPLFQDTRVFTKPGDDVEHHCRVDLLLDASASRLNAQEIISAQTYVLAKSLEKVHVPCRVLTFRSLRGFTVLQQLKSYDQKSLDGLLDYYAAGWNRDGLALRTCGRLIRAAETDRSECEHILFILTDANPDDSTHMPPAKGRGLEREYEGKDAVTDTAEAVKMLRASGIHTVAVYLGSTLHVDNVRYIYGTEYVTVRNIETLAARIGELLMRTLTELKN